MEEIAHHGGWRAYVALKGRPGFEEFHILRNQEG
jgi:hypothetical protein